MQSIVVVEDARAVEGQAAVGALDYLLNPAYAAPGAFEVQNDCYASGAFGARAYVDRFAWARQHRLLGAAPPVPRPTRARGPLGVLRTPALDRGPSSAETLAHLEALAAGRGIPIRWLQAHELDRLGEVGALFIRDDTSSLNHTLAFALRAEALGVPVIDASAVIEACADKATEAELFAAHGLPTPLTRLICAANLDAVVSELGFPFVLKRVDGSYSHEVFRVDDAVQLAARLPALLEQRLFAVAQAYRPSAFDWRVATLGGELLFAARYHAVPGHWQVARWEGDTLTGSGRTEAVPLAELPAEVGALALAATRPFGDGLLGVDLKMTDEGPLLIEVNDCVDVDVGLEDASEGDRVYHRILDALGYG